MTGAAASLLWSLRMGAAPPGVDTRISARLDSRRRRRRLGGSRRGRGSPLRKMMRLRGNMLVVSISSRGAFLAANSADRSYP